MDSLLNHHVFSFPQAISTNGVESTLRYPTYIMTQVGKIQRFPSGILPKKARNMCFLQKYRVYPESQGISGFPSLDIHMSRMKTCPTNKFFSPKEHFNISLHCWFVGVLFPEYVGKVFDGPWSNPESLGKFDPTSPGFP